MGARTLLRHRKRLSWIAVSALRASGLLAVVSATAFLSPSPTRAVPSFAQQTGQPCQACHIGAFGPQLKPYGRDFKLYGYQSSDKKNHEALIAFTVQSSLTHTNESQNPPPAPHFGDNDNFAVDQVSVYYAGRAPFGFGVFSQATYDGVARAFNVDNVDVRKVKEVSLFGRDGLVGLDFNNNPTVSDVWNSTPAWSFPYNQSSLAPGANAAPLIAGELAGQVIGSGLYGLFDDSIYLEASLYSPLNRVLAGRLGEGTNSTSDRYIGPIPYWRVALLHDVGTTQTMEIGAFGLRGGRYPGGDVSQGADTLTDVGVDANYQYIGSGEHEISAHGAIITEDQDLEASQVLFSTRRRNTLTTARADVSYSFKDTFTPSVQAFSTTGSFDPALYNSGLRTSGYVLELAYTPWGKAGSPVSWANARFAAQYTGYTEFDGDHQRAAANNTLYLNVWLAIAPLGGLVAR